MERAATWRNATILAGRSSCTGLWIHLDQRLIRRQIDHEFAQENSKIVPLGAPEIYFYEFQYLFS
jgi:hypothetical protein